MRALIAIDREMYPLATRCLSVEKCDHLFVESDSVGARFDVDLILADWSKGQEWVSRLINNFPCKAIILFAEDHEFGDADARIQSFSLHRIIRKPLLEPELRLAVRMLLNGIRAESERAELLHKLQVAHDNLKKLNDNLEEKVRYRTEIIRAQNVLLTMFVDGAGFNEILHEAAEVAREFSGSERAYILSGSNCDEWMGTDTEISPDLRNVAQALKGSTTKATSGDYLLYPLWWRSEAYLGVLILVCARAQEEDILVVEKHIVPLIGLAMMQQKYVVNAPEILDSLENLMNDVA